MSKKSRSTDNSKRQQPVQQQRAEAARQATASKTTERREPKAEREPGRATKA